MQNKKSIFNIEKLPEDLIKELGEWLDHNKLYNILVAIKTFRTLLCSMKISLIVKGKNLYNLHKIFHNIEILKITEFSCITENIYKLMPMLISLDFSDTYNITNNEILLISKLKLSSLNLSTCAISNLTLKYISEGLNKTLTYLNISLCYDITNDGLQYIQKLSKLTFLDLGSLYKITDEGLNYISYITTLKYLNM